MTDRDEVASQILPGLKLHEAARLDISDAAAGRMMTVTLRNGVAEYA